MADIPDEPKKSPGDFVYAIAKAATSTVPVVGGPAAELLGQIFSPPLEKRRERWMRELADAVKELQDRVIELTPEKLSANEAFITTAMHASQIATRTHQQEKLDALRNAVVNAAMPDAPDETMQQIFLNHVDNLTPWHLRILAFYSGPLEWGRKHDVTYPSWTVGAPEIVLQHAFPELANRADFYNLIANDLQQRGLMSGGSLQTAMTAPGMFSPRITPLGGQFLKFISRQIAALRA